MYFTQIPGDINVVFRFVSEEEVIKKTVQNKGKPLTFDSLKENFLKLGVRPGMVLLVHSSLSSLGWVCGDAVAVILSLEEVLGTDGTLVMPAFSGHISEPSQWNNPPVPGSWWPTIRNEMPLYDSELTPARGVGVIAETFRKQSGVVRSNHPQVSFTARGKYADRITRDHSLDYAFGEGSPLARVYDLSGWVMLLGVDYISNTSIHLAEYRSQYKGKTTGHFPMPVMINGQRQWLEFEDIKLDDSDFNRIGIYFENEFPDKTCILKVGEAETRLFRQRDVVDYATAWMSKYRNKKFSCD